MSALTVALTMLHAGGKFGSGGYKVSGGLHGVGVSVVNALSKRLSVEVKRDGYRWTQDFTLGEPNGPLQRHEPTKDTGTTVTFYASPDIFETTAYSYEKLATRFREMAFLNKGLSLTITDERPDRIDDADNPFTDTFRYDDGLIDYVKYLTGQGPCSILGDRRRSGEGLRAQRRGRRCSGTPPTTSRSTPSPTRSILTRRHPRGRVPGGADQHGQQVGARTGG